MKKIISIISILTLLTLAFASCNAPSTDDYQLKIGYLSGPTGMGMAKLIGDNGGRDGNEKYSFVPVTADKVSEALTGGQVDIACMPTNVAASLYNNNQSIEILAINCLNSIYVITDKNTTINSFEELEGKTIYTCKGGTPAPILKALLTAYGINATVTNEFNGQIIAKPENLTPVLTSKEGAPAIVVAPEPIITAASLALKSAASNDNEYSVDIDLGAVWKDKFDTDITMGCIVATKDVIKNHKSLVDNFLNEYKASIEYINDKNNTDSAAEMIVAAGVLPKLPVAKKALGNLYGSIVYQDGEAMKSSLVAFYNAIDCALPSDSFYYEK